MGPHSVSVPTSGLCSLMLSHGRFLGQLGSFRCRGLGMSHRIPLGIGGITGFRAASAVARLNCHFWQEYCHFWQEDYLFWDYCHFANIFCLFWRFAQKNFGFHRVSRISEGFRGFHRVSSAESASRHSSAGYVFEALARWRAESVGWNTYLPCPPMAVRCPKAVTTLQALQRNFGRPRSRFGAKWAS